MQFLQCCSFCDRSLARLSLPRSTARRGLSRARRWLLVSWTLAALCGGQAGAEDRLGSREDRLGSREDRQALFDYLVAKTLEREAFSEIKNERLGLDVVSAMGAYEAEIVDAGSEEELFYALVKLSNARRDRHLKVRPVEGGLRIAEHYPLSANTNYPELDTEESGPPTAPVRFAVDFGGAPDTYGLFVADLGTDLGGYPDAERIRAGDLLVAVDERPVDDYIERIRPYYRYSTENGFRVRSAAGVHRKTPILPRSFYRDRLTLTLDNAAGERFSVTLPYVPADSIDWQGLGERTYDGFEQVEPFGAFDLYRHLEKPVLLLSWRRFSDTLVEDMDALMELAVAKGWLDHDLVWDGTRSRGGGRGAYALQRLSPRPFKTTFGNLRLSDITRPFIELKRKEREEEGGPSDGVPETLDDGTWLMEWLEGDVLKGLEAGQAYSNDVPFKTAHAPEWSDGVLRPADTHFRGRMVCLLSPFGGSHLDQFAAIVVDNGLCPVLGMPAGGYSNTWEWEEEVRFPISGQPVVEFMWSIGHTIRPNGEVLEGNPAQVDDLYPVTRENYLTHHGRLLDRALEILSAPPAR